MAARFVLVRLWCVWLALVVLLCGPACRRSGPPGAARESDASASRDAPATVASVAPAAASSPPPSSSATVRGDTARGLFYKVQSSSSTAYLLGSIHVGKQGLYPLRPAIESAFDDADVLVLEVYLSGLAKLSAGAKLASAGLYPPGDSLDRHLSPNLVHAVQRQLHKEGDALPNAHRMRPWFLAMTLTLGELQRVGYDPEYGIDQYFQNRASGTKQIASLETVDDQVELFSGLSEKVQELMLKETLDELPNLDEMMQAAFGAWQTGNAGDLEAALLEAIHKPEYRPLYQRMFTDRNAKMARAIAGYLETAKTYFVVIGSGHLVGKQGVVELLRARRFRVEQQ